jgi:hypothetical protein
MCCIFTTVKSQVSIRPDCPELSRYPLVGIVTWDESLSLSGTFIFTRCETCALVAVMPVYRAVLSALESIAASCLMEPQPRLIIERSSHPINTYYQKKHLLST